MNKFETSLAAMTFIFVSFFCALNGAQAATIVIDDDNEPSAPNFLTTNYADAATCIQAALNGAASGDTITFREGDYQITKSVIQKGKNLNLVGEGDVKFHFSMAAGTIGFSFTGTKIIETAFSSDAGAGTSTITLADTTGVAAGDLIRIYNNTPWAPVYYPTLKTGETYIAQSVSGKNVTLTTELLRDYAVANGSRAIIYKPAKINISHLSFYGLGEEVDFQGVSMQFCKDSSVSDSYFDDNGTGAIYVRTCSNVDVGNNTIIDSNRAGYGYGVAVVEAATNVRIHNNLIRNCRHAITSGHANIYGVNRDVSITDNVLYRDNGKGQVVDAQPSTINYTVTGNTIYAGGLQAFNDGTLYSIFSNNTVYDCEAAVTQRGEEPGYTKIITGNHIEGPISSIFTESGLSLKEVVIKDNVLIGNFNVNGIQLSNNLSVEKLTISGNNIKNAGNGMSISIINAAASEIDISNNIIESSQNHGIYLQTDGGNGSNQISVSGNTITNSARNKGTYDGINLVNVDYAEISGNQITDSNAYTRYGIYEDASSDYNAIRDNRITGMKTGVVKISGANTVESNNGDIVIVPGDTITHSLTVTDGTGDGSYAAGASVTITAGAPAAGKVFDRWTGDIDHVSNVTSSATTVNMPAAAVTLTATYKDAPVTTYILTVNHGNGDGSYTAGTGVTIIADAPATGKVFDKWTGDTGYVSNISLSSTTLAMPTRSVSVSATYKDIITTTTPTNTTTTPPSGGSGGSTTPPASTGGSSSSSTGSATGATDSSTTGGTPATTAAYPTGTLLKLAGSFKVYVVIEGKKKWISTPEVFEQLGYRWTEIKTVTTTQLNAFADYEDNLIRQIGDYKVYLVVSGVRRHIPNPAIFLDYGFKWEEVKDVPAETVNKYKAAFLLKESGKEGIYYVSANDVRKLVPNTAISESYGNKAGDAQVISKTEMESYPLSQLVRLSGTSDVYLIEGNIKKRIPSPAVFNRYKFIWDRVIDINRTEFDFYQDGEELR